MKNLSQLIQEAEERCKNQVFIPDGNQGATRWQLSQILEKSQGLKKEEWLDNICLWLTERQNTYLHFLKTELTNIVKESFKNTRVEEIGQINQNASAYNQALSDKHNKQNQFLNN